MEENPCRINFEPFRIKSVENIKQTTREERVKLLQAAHYNPFLVKAEDVMIDLLTDSGTCAMSSAQWSAVMLGDEAYAGSRSYDKFEAVIKKIYGYCHVIPTHQGRAAERILFKSVLKPGDIVVNNAHFDTTRANVESNGAVAINVPVPEALDAQSDSSFKGNMDIERLEKMFTGKQREKVAMVMLTVTNNALGGSPVSMVNIRDVSRLCRTHGVPFYFDACRFAENAWFIKIKEEGYAHKTPTEIAQEMFSYADGCTMSAKKNGLANIGGFIALNDDDVADKCIKELVISEGFISYGGMAGRDLEAIAVGLQENLEESYLRYQINCIQNFANMLQDRNIPILTPPGGHAVYIDAAAMLPHIPVDQFPAWALVCALYTECGVRGVELGSMMFGVKAENGTCPSMDEEEEGQPELVRLAIPKRVYTESHLWYVAEGLGHILKHRHVIIGYRITWSTQVLRHFTAHLEPITEKITWNNNNKEEKAASLKRIRVHTGSVLQRKTSLVLE